MKDLIEYIFKDSGKTFLYYHGYFIACASVELFTADLHRDIVNVSRAPGNLEIIALETMRAKIAAVSDPSTAELWTKRIEDVVGFLS